jgi:hypothetical protein
VGVDGERGCESRARKTKCDRTILDESANVCYLFALGADKMMFFVCNNKHAASYVMYYSIIF